LSRSGGRSSEPKPVYRGAGALIMVWPEPDVDLQRLDGAGVPELGLDRLDALAGPDQGAGVEVP
jgi:hypothetical protein